MDYSEYYKARDVVTKIMKKDWLGHVEIGEIICDERPLDYYIVGKLYPQESDFADDNRSPSEDCGNIDEESAVSLNNSRNPSSFGLSFSLNPSVTSFIIDSKAAQYILIDRESAQKILEFKDEDYKKNARFWRHAPLTPYTTEVNVEELTSKKNLLLRITEKLVIKVILHKIYSDNTKTISVTMINEETGSGDYIDDCIKALFQPEIIIISKCEKAFGDINRNVQITGNPEKEENKEIAELAMLYSRFTNFASGHGCAVNWELDANDNATRLFTEFLPEYELNQMMPTQSFKHKVLQMKYLSEASVDDVITGLNLLLKQYTEWIIEKEKNIEFLPKVHRNPAHENMNKCKITLDTIRKSIDELRNKDVFKAFALANKAMFMQRKKIKKITNDNAIEWYPFQLAFFLQEIISFTKPNSEQRKKLIYCGSQQVVEKPKHIWELQHL